MERFEIDGRLPVDIERLAQNDEFMEQYSGLARPGIKRRDWAGFDESKAKEIQGRIKADWKNRTPGALYRWWIRRKRGSWRFSARAGIGLQKAGSPAPSGARNGFRTGK